MLSMDVHSIRIIKKWRLGWHLSSSALRRFFWHLDSELVGVPLEPILHPSPGRLWWLGLFTATGHPLFFWLWNHQFPQPYENLSLRAAMALLGLGLMSRTVYGDPSSKTTAKVFSVVFWLQLPVFFSWMYLNNHGNTVWLASECAMILIYYHVTDWRIATVGTAVGGLIAWWCYLVAGQDSVSMGIHQVAVNAIVIAFCWASALLLGLSTANLRREQLRHTLATMGIMAHELRTPLATISLIGDALRNEAQRNSAHPSAGKIEKFSQRMHILVRNMNHQIDSQIANARLLSLPGHDENISAQELARDVIKNFPYRNTRERECLALIVRKNFVFQGSVPQFSQVLDNLIKNALHALAAAGKSPVADDITIEIGVLHGKGRILVADQGVGIEAELIDRIFEPFFSTDLGTGHGLGLAFCKRVVQMSGGTIKVKSDIGRGAIFIIEVPVLA